MKKEIHDLIECVRALGIELTGNPAPKCIRISGDTSEFADKLKQVQIALEAVDASGAASDGKDVDGPEGINDPVKLRAAIDGLLRFVQVKGDFLAEADAIVRDALNLDQPENTKSKGGLPSFTPSRMKKRRGTYKPRLNVFPERPGEASLNDLKKIVHEISVTESLLGSTIAKPVQSALRSQAKAFGRPPGM
ncbi:hypothetical protein [Mesorhizobium sp. SP-1A]|uniref:hypothetical protein n=1 Tax=Mesorhizobium sp. SP-1A TaxID=3077840 RepID=UPI0028F6D672|nr:hypothetical protein [Mesorhizobium sp. SP-1A]